MSRGDSLVSLDSLITDPMSEEVASGFTAAAASSALSYATPTTTYWNSGKFNQQGQLWTQATAGNAADGCKNLTTAMHVTVSGVDVPISSVITVRTRLKGGARCGLVFKTATTCDYNIHIRPVGDGPLKRIQARPIKDTTTGTRRINITAPSTGDWEIWCTASAYEIATYLPSQSFRFVGIEHDGAASLERTPDTRVVIGDGDSWFHPAGAAVAHTVESYRSFGIIDRLEERTGWVFARVANGGTGFRKYPNSSSTPSLSDHTTGGVSVIGSYLRRAIVEQIVTQEGPNILLYLGNGTYNDGDNVGDIDAMAALVTTYMDFLRTLDPNLPVLWVGVEPFDNWTVDAPNGKHGKNNLGIKAAMAAAPNRTINDDGDDGFINAADPAWFTGTGDEYRGGTGVQATIIGGDSPKGIHPNYAGVKMYGDDIVDAMLPHQISGDRALAAA